MKDGEKKMKGKNGDLSNHLLDARCSAFSVPILTPSLRGKCPHYPDFTDEGNGGSGRMSNLPTVTHERVEGWSQTLRSSC